MARAQISGSAKLVPADSEGEGPFGGVGVDRERVPMDLVASGPERFQSDRHGVATDLRLALVDAGAAGVGDLGGAEGRLQVLRERQHDLMRRRGYGAADQRTGV